MYSQSIYGQDKIIIVRICYISGLLLKNFTYTLPIVCSYVAITTVGGMFGTQKLSNVEILDWYLWQVKVMPVLATSIFANFGKSYHQLPEMVNLGCHTSTG